MGEAKRRGTFEERRAAALVRQNGVDHRAPVKPKRSGPLVGLVGNGHVTGGIGPVMGEGDAMILMAAMMGMRRGRKR